MDKAGHVQHDPKKVITEEYKGVLHISDGEEPRLVFLVSNSVDEEMLRKTWKGSSGEEIVYKQVTDWIDFIAECYNFNYIRVKSPTSSKEFFLRER